MYEELKRAVAMILPKNILISISTPDDVKFFRRFKPYFDKRQIHVSYLANNLPIYLYLKRVGERVRIVRKTESRPSPPDNFSVRTQRLTQGESDSVYGSVLARLQRDNVQEQWDLFVIPSGRLINNIAMTHFARANGIATIYTGFGNITGRTFADSKGTDKSSLLFDQPEILDNYPVDTDEFEFWRQNYVASKLKRHVIGQARSADWALVAKKLIQIAFCKLERTLGLAVENSYRFRDLRAVAAPLDRSGFVAELPSKYIFFPMQVSTDAQVILNYKGGSLKAALIEAHELAVRHGLPLVVKPHPAEINAQIQGELFEFCRRAGYVLSDHNTFELIAKSEFVVTINSTVGLEAMLVGKEVTFLGDSLYKHLKGTRLAQYVFGYLLPIEYFDSSPIEDAVVEKFLYRARIL